jgi:hypothetical protein
MLCSTNIQMSKSKYLIFKVLQQQQKSDIYFPTFCNFKIYQILSFLCGPNIGYLNFRFYTLVE